MRVLVESHVLDIPVRIREVTGDDNLKVYYNTDARMFEVWGVDAAYTPYVISRFPYLDERVVVALQEAYWVARTTGEPYKKLLRKFDEMDYRREKEYWKGLYELEYRSRDVLRFSDTPVVPGWRAGQLPPNKFGGLHLTASG